MTALETLRLIKIIKLKLRKNVKQLYYNIVKKSHLIFYDFQRFCLIFREEF
jgi:hypothetical protein